jgi:radical SAM/Cys-rich protein
MPPSRFANTLEEHSIKLAKAETSTLQINVGLTCDLACRHCHLDAGHNRKELMSKDTLEEVIAFAGRFSFASIDITGGAPELLPELPQLVEQLTPLTEKLNVRTNLTALGRTESSELPELYRKHGVVIVASLPSINANQTESQRGSGVWEINIAMLRHLNRLGYGVAGSGLELVLVANPAGAFLPVSQAQTETRFRLDLERRFGITFNSLYTFANVPLGRFKSWLEQSGNFNNYMSKLEESFNPCTLPGLMCRRLISVDWNGFLYDCDFNLAAGLHHGAFRTHISGLCELPAKGVPIPTGDHCFACTAGSGFT